LFDSSSGFLDIIVASGSALKGETPLEAAMRELREETGIEGHMGR